jgi:hypothetical protein
MMSSIQICRVGAGGSDLEYNLDLGERVIYDIVTNIEDLEGEGHKIFDEVVLTCDINIDKPHNDVDFVNLYLYRGIVGIYHKYVVVNNSSSKTERVTFDLSRDDAKTVEYKLTITSLNGFNWERVFSIKYIERVPVHLRIVEQPQAMSNVEIGKDLELRVRAELTGSEELIEYLWFGSIDGSNVGGAPIQGANRSTYSVPTGAEGEYGYYVEIRAKEDNGYVSVRSDIAVVHVIVPSSEGDSDNGGGIDTGGDEDITIGEEIPNDNDNLGIVTILFVFLLGLSIVVILTTVVLLKIKKQTK